MRSSPNVLARMSGVIALILGMLAMLWGAQPAVAQGNSSVTVHNRVCPTNYEGTNYFDDCHDNPLDPGYAFTFTNEDTGEIYNGTTNADGDVGFANLSEGTYTIVGGPPGDVTESFAYCAVGTEANPNREQVSVDYVSGGIQFFLPADTNVICDWYTIPIGQGPADPTPTEAPTADSSIEVHHRVCPADYEGTNWFDDCHSNVADPGLPFTFADGVTREGTTNENGNVGFANLPAGTWTITGGAPGEFTDSFVYCSPEQSQQEVPVTSITGGIELELAPNTNLVCDWYAIPQSQDGQTPPATEPVAANSSIEVHNRVCPVEYDGTNWFEDCHDNAPDPGLPFTFTNGETREGTTNENGNVGFANLSAGTWTITGGAPGEFADRVVYCSTENTNDEVPIAEVSGGIQLELPANTNVVCDWYQIPYDLQGNGDPTATEPSANRFDMPVYTLLCADDPGAAVSDFVMGGVMPTGCEQYAGASVTIATQGGDVYGTCTTGATDPCFVNVDIGGTVVATIDPATLPADYTVLGGQTQQVQVPPQSEAWTLFVAVPAVQTPAPTETPALPEVPETPVEGRTVTIHTGTCAPSEPGAVVVELTDLTGPELGPDATADVVLAETSSSVIDLALADIMADEHALIAYSDDEAETPVACTALDGEMNADGELVLGLQEVNDSGYAGIVYLAPADDPGQTRISVFLAEDLTEEDADAGA